MYLYFLPQGGFSDILTGLNEMIEYCKIYNRIILFDTQNSMYKIISLSLIFATFLLSTFTTILTVGLELVDYKILGLLLSMIVSFVTIITIPLIVGGGIHSKQAIEKIYNAGADLVVIGTAFENDSNFFETY